MFSNSNGLPFHVFFFFSESKATTVEMKDEIAENVAEAVNKILGRQSKVSKY